MTMRRALSASLMLLLFILLTWQVTAQDNTLRSESGTITNLNAFDTISFDVTERNRDVVVDMRGTSGDLDTKVYLLDSVGEIVAVNDDRESGVRDSQLVLPDAPLGSYTVIATRYQGRDGSTTGQYDLVLEQRSSGEENVFAYDTSPQALAATGFPDFETREPAAWTVLAYYGGDTNLEAGVINDLNEFELGGGSDETVRVIALLDRHPEYSDASDNWSGARLFEITADVSGDHLDGQTPTIDSEPIAILDTLDTGNGEVLSQFLVWALQTYPAEQYALALASHGAGWAGIIADETDLDTLLTIPELTEAFSIAKESSGVERFDLIINDACLMSSVEYHNAMADFFDYSLASPEIIVNPALDMQIFTQTLREMTDIPISDLGAQLVDQYINVDIVQRQSSDVVYLTNSLIELNAFENVVVAIENFARLINQQPRLYRNILGQVRANTYTYTAFANSDELIDLGDFMQGMIEVSSDPDIVGAAQDVIVALDAALVYGNGGTRAATSTYHNIYFPSDSRRFESGYLLEAGLPQWASMLQTYYNLVEPNVWSVGDDAVTFHQPQPPQIRIYAQYPLGEVSSETGFAMDAEFIGRNLAFTDVTFDQIQDDGSVVRYSTERLLARVGDEVVNDRKIGVSFSSVSWDVTLPQLSDGVNSRPELFIITEDVSALEARYREPNSEIWSDVTLIFSEETGRLERIISRAVGDSTLGVIEIPTGSILQTYRSVVTRDGRAVTELGDVYIWPDGGPTRVYRPAPSGDYNIGLLTTTYGGTTSFTSTNVTIDNDEADSDVRRSILSRRGILLAFPADYEDATTVASGHLQASNEAGTHTQNAFFGFYGTDGVPLRTILDEFAEPLGMDVTEDRSLLTLRSGKTALEFDYVRTLEDGSTVDGRGLVSLARANTFSVGIILGTEVSDGDTEALESLYALLSNESNIFDIFPIEDNDTRQWANLDERFSSIPNVIYPIFRSWYVNESDGIWFRHGAGRDIAATDRVAVAVLEEVEASADELLDQLMSEEVIPALDNVTEVDRSFYPGENETWNAVIFDAARDGQAIRGRLYVTFGNGNAYAVWMEAAVGDDTESVYTDLLEPIVDGFEIFAPE